MGGNHHPEKTRFWTKQHHLFSKTGQTQESEGARGADSGQGAKESMRTNIFNFLVKWEEGQAEDKGIKGGYSLREGGWGVGRGAREHSWAGDHKFARISACMDLQWLSSNSMKSRQRRGKDGE